MASTLPTVAIVGRPNVGKSTLFNRLVGRRTALVHNTPGVTRDRKTAVTMWRGLKFHLVDTPGLYDSNEQGVIVKVLQGMRQQAIQALKEAKIILFMIDGIDGCTPYDEEIARLLRPYKNVFVVVNKCESKTQSRGFIEAQSFGFKNIIEISAEHGLGMFELYEFLAPYCLVEGDEENNIKSKNTVDEDILDEPSRKPLRLMVMGRPNVGKSTLLNALIGEERLLTADMPGVTRDAIELEWRYQGRPLILIDTAGLRRSSRIHDPLEKLSVMDAKRALQFTDAVILVIDGTLSFEDNLDKQDFKLASMVLEEGRILIIAINKWDVVQNKDYLIKKLSKELKDYFAQTKDVPIVPISATEQRNLAQLMTTVFEMDHLWNRRLSTAKLNEWLSFVTQEHAPPAVARRRIRLKFMNQKKTRPPTFVIHGNQLDALPESYVRFLINSLRRDFKMPGIPIRMLFKNSHNPYARTK